MEKEVEVELCDKCESSEMRQYIEAINEFAEHIRWVEKIHDEQDRH